MDIKKIKTHILFENQPPDWFDSEKDLPKYAISKSIKDALEADKKRQSEKDELKKAFLAALDAAVPDDLMGRLQSREGCEGLSVMASFSGVYSLYSKNISGSSGYLGDYTKTECLRMAALLCLHGRELLPEDCGSGMRAVIKLKEYALGKKTPEWFKKGTSLPELTI